MGEAQTWQAVLREEKLAGGFSILSSMLNFGVGEGAMEAGVLTDCSARGRPGDLVSVSGVANKAGTSPRKVAVGLESEEVMANGSVVRQEGSGAWVSLEVKGLQ